MVALRGVLTAVASCFAVAGCSYGYDIYTTFDGKNFLFNTSAEESRFAPGLCLRYLEVKSGTTVVWGIVREGPLAENGCQSDFPITYGSPPPRFKATAPPSPLRPGVVYEVSGMGDASFKGFFRYSVGKSVTVENLKRGATQQ